MEPTEVEDLVSDQPTPISDEELSVVRSALAATNDPALVFGRRYMSRVIARLDAAEAKVTAMEAVVEAAKKSLIKMHDMGFQDQTQSALAAINALDDRPTLEAQVEGLTDELDSERGHGAVMERELRAVRTEIDRWLSGYVTTEQLPWASEFVNAIATLDQALGRTAPKGNEK